MKQAIRQVWFNERALDADIRCVLLARLGFSHEFITSQTGLSAGKIQYRMRMLGLKLDDYRRGESPLAVNIARDVSIDAAAIELKIRKHMALHPPRLTNGTNGPQPAMTRVGT